MVYFALFLALLSLVFWVYVLFDVIGADTARVRLLPKPVWALIVLFLPKVGAALWFLLGRPPRDPALARTEAGPVSPFPEYEHPGRARAVSPEEDEAFLRRCRERAEEQRRRAREIQERESRERNEREHGDRGAPEREEPRGEAGDPRRDRDGDGDPIGPSS
ncbi:PLD nuclease N-terminal domain-containing protein [Nocardiopsis sp. NPDC006938]|uniref:PLD nuclease N-terminal domain-containing protein n=1 Tax=Nocardiopsis sp. NPDC006938 TaxID=3364337 RepID=UPI0036A1B40B